MKKRHLCFSMIIILAAALFCGNSQNAQTDKKKDNRTPQVEFNVNVILRMIDVIVLDKDGNHVEDLTKDDFEIYEEGKLQKVATFDNISFKIAKKEKESKQPEVKTAEEPAKPKENQDNNSKVQTEVVVPSTGSTTIGKILPTSTNSTGRSIVLLFDNYNTHQTHLTLAKEAAKRFIANDILPEDKVAIIKYYGSAKVLQDFTDDKAKLFGAINSLSVSLGDPVGRPEIADYRKSDLSEGGGYQANSTQWERSYTPYETDQYWDREEKTYNVKNFVDVLRAIGYSLKDVPGRKTIIFLSPGFLGANPVTTPYLFVTMGNVLERLSGYNITIYSVDVSGVATDQRGKREERWDFLTYVTDKTGGKLFKNRNDLQGQLQKVNYEISRYYMVGYYANDTYKDGRFININVKCKRPGTTVRTVKGVYATRSWDRIPEEERKNNLHRLLQQSSLYTQIPIKIEGNSAIPSEGGRIIYPLIVRFPVFALYKEYDYLSYDLYMLVKNTNGEQVDSFFQDIRIDKQNLVGNEFIVNFPLALKGGDYNIQMIVKNNISEELGAASLRVKIPAEIKGFAGSDPKIFTDEQSATIIFPESKGILITEAYYPHVGKYLLPVTGKKLYVDKETVISFSLVNFGMDLKKEQADVDTDFAMMKEGKVVTIPLDIKKFLEGKDKDIMTILIKIPPKSLTPGRYNLRVYCKNNSSEEILQKQVSLNFTSRQRGRQAENLPEEEGTPEN